MREKRIIALIIASILVLSMVGCASDQSKQSTSTSPKTGSATMKGYGGDITVTLTAEGDKLIDVKVVGEEESLTIGSVAVEKLPIEMLEKNSVRVDAISGATLTSSIIFSAAEKALTEIDMKPDDLKEMPASEVAEVEDVVSDVIVIGGGGAGISAAMAARDAGKEVVLLEKLSILGGNTALSGGVMTRSGVEGDPEGTMTEEELYEFYMTMTEGGANPDVVRRYVENSPTDLAWIHAMGPGIHETARYRTTPENIMAVQPAENSGRGLLDPMIKGLEESGTKIYRDTAATELIIEDGIVVGVKATNKHGQEQNFYANGGVVIATGGFPDNVELLAKYSSLGAERAITMCSPGPTGDGLVMAEKIGADVKFADQWDNIGSNSELDMGYMVAFPQLNSLLVNDSGERFISEDAQRPTIYKEMLFQIANGSDAFYFMFDENTIGEGADALVEKGSAFKADTLEELADLMEVPLDTLLKTVDRYNEIKDQEDTDFDKPAKFMLGLENGPFYAAKTWPIRTSTIGGLVINEESEVLDAQGAPIPGLFAGGEVANYSFFHNIYSTCGSAVGHAVVFGRIAGTNAANFIR